MVGEGWGGWNVAKGQKSPEVQSDREAKAESRGLLGRVDKRVCVCSQGGRKPLESPRGG